MRDAQLTKARRCATAAALLCEGLRRGVETETNVYREDGRISVAVRAYGARAADDNAVIAAMTRLGVSDCQVVTLLPEDDFRTYCGYFGEH